MLDEFFREANLILFLPRCLLLCLLASLFFLPLQFERVILFLWLLVPPVIYRAEDEVQAAPLSISLVLIALLLVRLGGLGLFGRLEVCFTKGRQPFVFWQQAPIIVHLGKQLVVRQLLFLLFNYCCVDINIGLLTVNSSN